MSDKQQFTTTPFAKKIEKPWGHEIVFTPEDSSRVGKILFVRKDHRLSFQYHEQKEETICLVMGKAILQLENSLGEIREINMQINFGYNVLPNQKHRIEAKEDSLFVEVSSPEVGTTHRLEDDYSRGDETKS